MRRVDDVEDGIKNHNIQFPRSTNLLILDEACGSVRATLGLEGEL